jgi:SAM-dependent methyltransferase
VDVGAAYGIFARAAKLDGWDVTAIEMDARCVEYLRGTVGVEALRSDQPELALAQLDGADAIVLWHVLEHLPRPAELLASAAALLEPGGLLAIAMPNPDALQFRLLRGRWAHVDAPRHLELIPAAALRQSAETLGLRLVELTADDPAGRHWNEFGWEHAWRRHPARRRSSLLTLGLARLTALALAPVERRGLNGTAYTAVFTKR